ncbi:MAG: FAD-dependent oxidoreductase [Alphaproteobacteria bacterium]|nr:FAD-dependent oxidoreductase [Alphaproteobacteria bacterium]
MDESVVVVGAGQAAAQLVASLRTEGFAGAITLIGEEPYVPYQRPPLSKAFLAGELAAERLFIKPEEFYTDAKCTLLLRTRATAIDRTRKIVKLDGGREVPYGTLALTTGSRIRKLALTGADLPGCFYLRGIEDVERLQGQLKPGARLAIIGAGYIGLEVAAVAVKRKLKVTVLEAFPRVMARAASEQISAFYEAEHRKAGVDIRCNVKIEAIAQDGASLVVKTSSGDVTADFVLIGIGILPNVELAAEAGLPVENGIVVDQNACTADPSIYAVGDCTNHPCAYAGGGRTRLESVQNAIDQAKHAAAAIVGKPKPYNEVPWFWSDQYDLKLQIAGLAHPADTVVLRGDPASRSFAAFRLRDGVLVAVEAVNAAPEYMMSRRLIAARARVAPERLADKAIPMKEMAT